MPDKPFRIPIILVHFPQYSGPPIVQGLGNEKLVPIKETTLRCDCKLCSRTGLALVVGKADSTHSVQGFTVANALAMKRVILLLTKESESRFPGIFYVAASRAASEQNIALDFPISREFLEKVGTLDTWRQQHLEVEALTLIAIEQRRSALLNNLGTTENLKELTLWIAHYATNLLQNPIHRQFLNPVMIEQITQCISEWILDASLPDE
jgi:hypothetical protein